MSDQVLKFLMGDGAVRIEAVSLTDTWRTLNQHRSLPPAVNAMLGELVAASTLLAATLKFNGSLVLQIQGDGPVRLAVVECAAGFGVRAAIKLNADAAISDQASFRDLVNAQGQGRFVIVLDPKDKLPGQQAYTGIVPLVGNTLAESLDYYFASSEQLPTLVHLAANEQCAAGLLVQRMPAEGGKEVTDTDAWDRARHLAATIKREELLSLPAQEVVRRLFWEEPLDVKAEQPVRFSCSCSREKVAGVLRMLGSVEIESILAEQGKVSVNCEYCDTRYEFDAVDAALAVRGGTDAEPGGALH
ncbi:MAG TPA: Hsp33 family molecular chaperone HslO [Burkholderiaceae bacterium]|nr:Hsp33 family molecular chaperone HslO [Burkholderiaceae bacterium]